MSLALRSVAGRLIVFSFPFFCVWQDDALLAVAFASGVTVYRVCDMIVVAEVPLYFAPKDVSVATSPNCAGIPHLVKRKEKKEKKRKKKRKEKKKKEIKR
jgi:hypothetical protein